jgi:hypothetical protein
MVMPSVTDVVKSMPGKEEPYRLFSGVAHAHFWALSRLGLARVPDQVLAEAGVAVPPAGALFEKRLMPEGVVYLASEIMDALAQIVWQRFVLFGWPRAQVTAALETAYDRLCLREGLRFWRTAEDE